MENINNDILDTVERRVEILKEVNRVFRLNREELKGYQKEMVRETALHVYKNNKFYREKLQAAGLNEQSIKELDVMDKLPFTTKSDIRDQYPFGLLSTGDDEVVRYGSSTGTTGEPINSYYTGDDWFANNCVVATILSNLITKEDTVALIVPYGLALVGQDVDRAMELIGAKTIAIDVLGAVTPVERAIKILKETHATALVCSPSRALFIAGEAKKAGFDPKEDFSVKKIFCVGEGTSKEKAKAIKEIYGADAYPLYGMTETNTLAMSCPCGKLHLMENKINFEIIDPDTEKTLKDNERGELVVTSFGKAMPLLRYRTGDLCTIHSEMCDCGSKFRYLEHHGRISDSVMMDGKRIQILDLEAVILPTSGAEFFTLKINKKKNELVVGLVLEENAIKAVEVKLKKALFDRFGIQTSIEKADEKKILEKIKNNVKPSISSILQESEE